jgi:hypothetical protein
MDNNGLRDIEASPRQHQIAIENLAQSLNHSIDGVNTLYQMVLRHYKKQARIKYFLSPLVVKRVKEVLRDTTPPPDIDGRRSRSGEL